jgi:hypothetical protein
VCNDALLDAITRSDGLAPEAGTQILRRATEPEARKQPTIFPSELSQGKEEIPVPFARIMSRESPDEPLAADDVLYVADGA